MSNRTSSRPVPGPRHSLWQMLRKDWLVFTFRDWAFILSIYFLASLQALPVDEAYLILGLALAFSLFIYVPVVEWFQEADPMLHSLPVHRDTVVVARYLIAIISGGVAGILWSATGRLLLPVLVEGRETPALFMTLEGGLTFLLALAMAAALYLPLYFGYGMVRGGITFLAACGILFPLAYATGGMAWGPGAEGIIPPSHLIGARVEALVGGVGPAGAITVVLLGTAGVFWVSLKLSQRLFRRREF